MCEVETKGKAEAAATAAVAVPPIQYCSDLHLEFYDKNNKGRIHMLEFIKPSAPFLALCGDIGNPSRPAYKSFLKQCSEAFERVFVIPGNHEYYNFDQPKGVLYTMDEKNQQMEEICGSFSNVVWLQEKSVELVKGVRICGATLWTDVERNQELEARNTMNDYNTIRMTGRGTYEEETVGPTNVNDRVGGEKKKKTLAWTPADMRIEHRKQKGMLRYFINEAAAAGDSIIVLTHHLPSFSWIHEDYKESKLNYCYASAMDTMIRAPVIAWLCGHTHRPKEALIQGVYCGINPRGYPGEKGVAGRRDAVFRMDWRPNESQAIKKREYDKREEKEQVFISAGGDDLIFI